MHHNIVQMFPSKKKSNVTNVTPTVSYQRNYVQNNNEFSDSIVDKYNVIKSLLLIKKYFILLNRFYALEKNGLKISWAKTEFLKD